MTSATDAPIDLYIAAYDDPDAAQADWKAIKQLANDDLIKIDGLILVSRREDGKIHVDDDFHESRKGAAMGAVGGAVVGLIFPPALLASAAVGAGIGAGAGALVSHSTKKEIKADVDDTLPLNSSGIVAIFEEDWADDIEKALLERQRRHEGEGRLGERRSGEVRGEHELADYEPFGAAAQRTALRRAPRYTRRRLASVRFHADRMMNAFATHPRLAPC